MQQLKKVQSALMPLTGNYFNCLFLPTLLLLFSCSSKENVQPAASEPAMEDPGLGPADPQEENGTGTDQPDPTAFNLSEWQGSFPFQSRITCFNEDSISHFEAIVWKNYDAYKTYSAPIIGKLAQQIEGIEKLESWHTTVHEETDFLYSIQRRKKHIGITVIGGNDSWVTEIRYLSFDPEGKKIADVVLAANGGDGGYYTRGRGCFINDSTYKYEFTETEYNAVTETEEIYETGSRTYIIRSTGEIKVMK